MKTHNFFTLVILITLLCSCGTQKFSIGQTEGQTFNQDKRKCIHLFWGIVPIGRKQSFPSYADAKGYIIITRYSALDYLATLLTGGIFEMKTVKYEPKK